MKKQRNGWNIICTDAGLYRERESSRGSKGCEDHKLPVRHQRIRQHDVVYMYDG